MSCQLPQASICSSQPSNDLWRNLSKTKTSHPDVNASWFSIGHKQNKVLEPGFILFYLSRMHILHLNTIGLLVAPTSLLQTCVLLLMLLHLTSECSFISRLASSGVILCEMPSIPKPSGWVEYSLMVFPPHCVNASFIMFTIHSIELLLCCLFLSC